MCYSQQGFLGSISEEVVGGREMTKIDGRDEEKGLREVNAVKMRVRSGSLKSERTN